MAFAKQGMQSSASIALNYLETSSSLGWNGLTISRVNPYRVAKPSATIWERHNCILSGVCRLQIPTRVQYTTIMKEVPVRTRMRGMLPSMTWECSSAQTSASYSTKHYLSIHIKKIMLGIKGLPGVRFDARGGPKGSIGRRDV